MGRDQIICIKIHICRYINKNKVEDKIIIIVVIKSIHSSLIAEVLITEKKSLKVSSTHKRAKLLMPCMVLPNA
jgi:hypothetical protein